MKRFIYTILFAIIISATTYAQELKEAIVKLKSGIEVRGEIIDQVAGEQVTLKTAEGDLFVYTMDDIVRIEDPNAAAAKQKAKEEQHQAKITAKNAAKQKREEHALNNYKGKGYRGIFEFSYGFDASNFEGNGHHNFGYLPQYNIGDIDNHHIYASFINGYNCGPKFFIGIGVGCKYSTMNYNVENQGNTWYNWEEISIPLFLHLRTAFTKNTRVTPYFSVNIGYNFGITPTVKYNYNYNFWTDNYFHRNWYDFEAASASGIYAEPSFGLEFRCKKKTAVFFAITAPMIMRTKIKACNQFLFSYGGKFGFSF